MLVRIHSKSSHYSPDALHGFEEAAEGGSFKAEIKLPAEVERGIILNQQAFGTPGLPLIDINSNGHGPSGMIFVDGMSDYPCIRMRNDNYSASPRWGVLTRISFGPSHSRTRTINEPSDLDKRLHISVRAGRIANFAVEKDGGYSDRPPRYKLFADKEEIHFSLRWLEGKFDDWNDISAWRKEQKSLILECHRFDEERTSFYKSSNSDIMLWGPGGSTDGEFAERFKRIYGDRRSILPQTETLKDFIEKNQGFDREKISHMLSARDLSTKVPTIGYTSILNILSNYGEVSVADAKKIPKMKRAEGTEYLFTKVLPAMIAYGRSA